MCGIAIAVGIEPEAAAALLGAVTGMHADLASRGPDGEGWLLVDACLTPSIFGRTPNLSGLPERRLRLAAAFRRLAIRDPRPAANQPLERRGGALWVLHNGEIYNDAEIRHELTESGHVFSTGTDAETVLAAYDAWGEACFERLRGMWATAIVDLTRGRLVLCRDRLGIKPLFVAADDRRVLVASHARAVAAARGEGARIEPARWHRFLRGWPADHAEGSFFEGVLAVPAGTVRSFDLADPRHNPSTRRYWSLTECLSNPRDTRTAQQTEAELAELLTSSVRDHLIADRPVGCLLSGGLDSSVVACLAARELQQQGTNLTGFSITFDDVRMSEWPYMQAVAAHAGLRLVTHRLAPREAWALVDDVVKAHGEPLLGQDTIAHYRAFGLAREHGAVVVLEGQGADELFAGLPAYEAVMFAEWLSRGEWWRILREARLRAGARGQSLRSVLRELVVVPAFRRWRQPMRRLSWLEGDHRVTATPVPQEGLERSPDASRLNRYLFDLVRHTNLPSVLLGQDRNAMAHGVENRPPFVDHRLVEWAFRLHQGAKVGEGRRKRVLWNAARRIVPPLVHARTDKRAIVSRNDWMPLRRAHPDALRDMAGSRALAEAPYIRRDEVGRYVDDYLRHAHDDHPGIWRLYTAWRWLETFHPAA